MGNRERAVEMLQEIALLKVIAGEPEVKAAAYDRAARTVEYLDDFDERVRAKTLAEVAGIGSSTARAVHDFLRTGTCAALDELRATLPDGLRDWLKVPGLGPKKIRKIHAALGIAALEDLRRACGDGRVAALPGFGEKSAARLAASVQWIQSQAGRFRMDEAEELVETLLAGLRDTPGIARVEAAGALRRGMETVAELELVATAEEGRGGDAVRAFCSAPGVREVICQDARGASVKTARDLRMDFTVTEASSHGAALLHATGNAAHLEELNRRARETGRALSPHGLFRQDATGGADSRHPLPASTEEEIYRQLGLPWIPPERREGLGECAEYASGAAAKLVAAADIRGVMHLHTTWSDGAAGIAEMARACMDRGYQWMLVTDHSQSAVYAGGLTPERLEQQGREVEKVNRALEGKFMVLHGVECDILPDGSLDYPEEILRDLDWVIASVHSRQDMPPDEMLVRMLRAVAHPCCDMIGHPTGRLLLRREGNALDLDRLCEEAVRRKVAVEINANPWRLDLDWRVALRARPKGLLTSINPDAHSTGGIDDIHHGLRIARKAGYSAKSVLCAWEVRDLLRWREKRRKETPDAPR